MNDAIAPVTLRQIQIFIEVAKAESFSNAAVHLHMTQSAVTKNIQKLEEYLGFPLFTRTTRFFALTDAGKLLFEEWAPLLDVLNTGYEKVYAAQKYQNEELRIGLINTARPDLYFWEIEKRFQTAYPQITLHLKSEYMTDLVEKLAAGTYDLIMVPDFERFSLQKRGLPWKWAARTHACVIIPRCHPLADRESVSMQDLLTCDFISLKEEQNANYLQDLNERFAAYDARPNLGIYFNSAYDVKYLYRSHEGLIFTDVYFDMPAQADTVKVPITDQYNGIICGYRSDSANPAVPLFLAQLDAI